MLRYNEHTRTLEQEDYSFELQDVQDPHLFRDIFSYGTVPKIPFNHRHVPMFPAGEIWITDTTFRDGQQSRQPYTVRQIVDLFTFLHRLGGPNGLIRQTEFFLYTPRDREALERCRELGFQYPEITGWIRATKSDFDLAQNLGLKEVGILTSASDYHIFLKLGKTRRQAIDMYLDIARCAMDHGIVPRCHLEDITRSDFYGFAVPFAAALMDLSQEYKMPIKIRCCDTMGYGVSYPGSMLPRSVPGIIYGLNHHGGVPSRWLEWHGHNDFYKSVINAATAWLYGCSSANGSLLGLGERTGNSPVEALVFEYIALRGDDEIDTTVVTEIAEYYRKELGHEIPRQQPFVGEDFNKTCAGIHADGLSKNEEIYTIFDTRKLLKRIPEVAINDKSGAAGIALWIGKHYIAPFGGEIPKSHPGVTAIKDWIDNQYATGRVTTIADVEMHHLVREHLPELMPLHKTPASEE
ncbi:MAG TPA: 2-isopropylmalate synthase [Candidatus Brocadiia bacterium]|nr:2-isopropylmalate synthase [Candidatus Brocadiia bacterium]